MLNCGTDNTSEWGENSQSESVANRMRNESKAEAKKERVIPLYISWVERCDTNKLRRLLEETSIQPVLLRAFSFKGF